MEHFDFTGKLSLTPQNDSVWSHDDIDVWAQANKLYPDCGCAPGWIHAWKVNFGWMDAMKFVEKWHHDHCIKHHKGNGHYLGAWAFTLTSSPKDGISVGALLKAVRKVMSQTSQPVVTYAWYLEYKGVDEDGLPTHPHVHGIYELEGGRKIEDKHWKRAWPIWDPKTKLGSGFRGGYHRPVRQEENYEDYIAKDGGIGECSGAAPPNECLDGATQEISV